MTLTLTEFIGTGGSGTILGTDEVGAVSITTGTGATTGQTLFTIAPDVTPLRAYADLEWFPIDATTKALTVSVGYSGAPLNFGLGVTDGLSDSTTYHWAYRSR